MAFSIKLSGMKWHHGNWVVVDVPGEISGDHVASGDTRFRRIAMTAGHLDYFAILSVEEALEITSNNNRSGDLKPDEVSPNTNEKLVEIKKTLQNVDLVFAHQFEWDSGFG